MIVPRRRVSYRSDKQITTNNIKHMNKKRKLPIGWRRLTPTEKIDSTCKYSCNDNLKNDPEMMANNLDCWCDMSDYHLGKTVKQEWPSGGFVVIKPIKSKAAATDITSH